MNRVATVSLSNVSKQFGDLSAVTDVTLKLDKGEVVGFVGPNGAGKTTTLSLIMGFLRPSAGTVKVFAETLTPESAHRAHRHIGYIAGDMALSSRLTGAQYLSFVASRHGRNKAEYEWLSAQLKPVLDKPIKMLSRGNKQKIALIAALQHKPKLLILDEPTSGLDPLMQEVFVSAIKRAASHGSTILMSSHILSEVSSICDRILFMKAGRLTLDKPIGTLITQTGKLVSFKSHELASIVQYLPAECQVVSRTAHQATISVPDDAVKPFLRWLLTKNFTDLTITERELDDIFHDLYKPDSKEAWR